MHQNEITIQAQSARKLTMDQLAPRRRDYAVELRATAVALTPAELHPLVQIVPAQADAPALNTAAPSAPPPPPRFDDPLQAALAEESYDPLGALSAKPAARAVDNTPIGVSSRSISVAPDSEYFCCFLCVHLF